MRKKCEIDFLVR